MLIPDVSYNFQVYHTAKNDSLPGNYKLVTLSAWVSTASWNAAKMFRQVGALRHHWVAIQNRSLSRNTKGKYCHKFPAIIYDWHDHEHTGLRVCLSRFTVMHDLSSRVVLLWVQEELLHLHPVKHSLWSRVGRARHEYLQIKKNRRSEAVLLLTWN